MADRPSERRQVELRMLTLDFCGLEELDADAIVGETLHAPPSLTLSVCRDEFDACTALTSSK